MAKRFCPLCRKKVDYLATVCPYCTREIGKGSWSETGEAGCVFFLIFLLFAAALGKCNGG